MCASRYDGKANRTQEAWFTPTLLNGWVAYDAPRTPMFMKDQFGFVHLKGLVKSGTVGQATPVFNLPAGYRPIAIKGCCVLSNDSIGQVNINSAGNVYTTTPTNNTYVYLDGIIFKAEV